MVRDDFDQRLRDRLEGVTEPAPDVWEGISQGLERRRRKVVFRRFTVAAAAAAAVLALALLVFRGPRNDGQVEAPVQIAETVEPVVAPVVAPDGALETPDIAPIAEQIAALPKQAVAASRVNKPVATVAPVVEEPAAEEPTVVTPVEEPVVTTPVDEPQAIDPKADEPQHLLTEDEIPADYWTREEASERSHSRTFTSQISILSNLTTVASDGDLLYIPSASHASSQSGKGQATSDIEPISEANAAKFYTPLTFGLQVAFPLTDRLSVATGVNYSYLVSQYDILYKKVLYEGAYNQLHYVGVPLVLSYHFVQTPHLGVYASVAGAAEKCVAQRYVFGSNVASEKVKGLQWSAKAGVGIEYWFIPHMGIYFDPSLVYFFDNQQPLSIRTQQPLQANFELGLRFKI
jgi:hypothetical protein